jgi:hypothetical protein
MTQESGSVGVQEQPEVVLTVNEPPPPAAGIIEGAEAGETE